MSTYKRIGLAILFLISIVAFGTNRPTRAASSDNQTPPTPEPQKQPQASIIAHYYGAVKPYEQLTAERSAVGKYVHCVVRIADPNSTELHEDCFNTLQEADQQVKTLKASLGFTSYHPQVHARQPLAECWKDVTLYYYSGYNSAIPGFVGICHDVNYAANYMWSDWVNNNACFRVYDFAYYQGNSAAICASYFTYGHNVGSMDYLG